MTATAANFQHTIGFLLFTALLFAATVCLALPGTARADMEPYPVVKLRSLDKISARTMTFEARVGSTVKFGPLYIKVQTCKKAPPIEQPESAAFLQIWEVTPAGESEWVFSGWMFASSPALSSMDHPVYDVWVLDCLNDKNGNTKDENTDNAKDSGTTEADAENTGATDSEPAQTPKTNDNESASDQENASGQEGAEQNQSDHDEAKQKHSVKNNAKNSNAAQNDDGQTSRSPAKNNTNPPIEYRE